MFAIVRGIVRLLEEETKDLADQLWRSLDHLTNRFNFNEQARLSQSDLISGLQSYSTRTRRHCDRCTVPLNARSMSASIVAKPILARIGSTGDVGVSPGHAQIGLSSLGERHVIRPDQSIPAIANFQTTAEVDPCRREKVSRLFSRAVSDCQLQTADA